MKLTDRVLRRELQKAGLLQDACLYPQNTHSAIILKGLLWMRGDIRPEDGWCYAIGQEDPRISHLIREFEEQDKRVLLLVPPDRTGELGNAVTRAFLKYDAWRDELQNIIRDFGTVEDLLFASIGIFENPIYLLREDLTVQSLTWYGDLPIAYQMQGQGKGSVELVNTLIQDPSYRENLGKTESYWGPEDLTGYPTIAKNIPLSDGRTYILWIPQFARALDPADLDLLDALSQEVAFLLRQSESSMGRRDEVLEQLFRAVVSETVTSYSRNVQDLTSAGWLREHDYVCSIFESSYGDAKRLPAGTVCSYLRQEFPACCPFQMDGRIICYFNLTLSHLTFDELTASLTQFIRDSLLRTGYSRMQRGYAMLWQQYFQAKQALEIGSRIFPHLWIHHFDQCALAYLLGGMTRDLGTQMVCHPALLKLSRVDHEAGTQYVKTLHVYLRNGLNAVHAAKELEIHRSTFLYRMERMRELAGDLFEDPDTVLYLWLSCELLEAEG